ncbi:leucine-rich repeat domain-containing protein, partial [Apibacter sp. wkB309]|uniref:leucine-rich repeat domain-containing protein n=1 Tax=Apibacter sp. wkB309 TaxID=1679467 RepID=UPI000D43735D
MKNFLLFLFYFLSIFFLWGQVKVIDMEDPGSLSKLLGNESNTITNLKITGSINPDDIKTLNNMKKLTVLDLSNSSVTDGILPKGAFQSNSVLKNIILPSNITIISKEAFEYAYNISVDASKCSKLENIGEYAFNGVKGKVVLPDHLFKIDSYAFSKFGGSVVLPAALITIDDKAFMDTTIKEIDLTKASNLQTIGNYAFASCVGLKVIDFSKNTKLNKIGKYAFGESTSSFWSRTAAKVILPDNLSKIDPFAFSKFGGSVVLPTALITIDDKAFMDTAIKEIDLARASNLQTIGNYAFASCVGLKVIDFSKNTNLNKIGKYAFGESTSSLWSRTAAKVILPDNLSKIDPFAFSKFGGSVVLPAALITIDDKAFMDTTIKEIDLTKASNLQTIGNYAFASCIGLKVIDFSKNTNLNKIGKYAFGESISSLWSRTAAKVILPDNLSKIDPFAFSKFGGSVVLPAALITIDDKAFMDTTIKEIDLTRASNLQTIGNYAFASCEGLKVIDFSKNTNLNKIGKYAFGKSGTYNWARTAAKVILPDNLSKIDPYAFSQFGGSVVLPAALITIDDEAFMDTTIKEIDLTRASNLQSIGNYAFASCEGLKVIDFSKNTNLNKIGKYAFGKSGTYNWARTAAKVILPDNLSKIDPYAFSQFGGSVVLPAALITID